MSFDQSPRNTTPSLAAVSNCWVGVGLQDDRELRGQQRPFAQRGACLGGVLDGDQVRMGIDGLGEIVQKVVA